MKRAPVTLGRISPTLGVPGHIPRPDYSQKVGPYITGEGIPLLKDEEDLRKMRESCRIASLAREYAGSMVVPGATTDEIDRAVHSKIISLGAYPSPLGYAGFPKSLCASVNEILCHGIPDSREMQYGDIVKLDCVVYKDGFHGDNCGTFVAGGRDALQSDDAALNLLDALETALKRAIGVCKPGALLQQVGEEIAQTAEEYNVSISEVFFGHGVGREIHCLPCVMHHRNDSPVILEKGMAFTIEPILAEGDAACHGMADGWAAATDDGSRTAQHEETVLITDDGAEILTKH